MSITPLKQQAVNYVSLFRQLFFDYYSQQKKLFWVIQLLIVVSTVTGLFWILCIILGISHYQNPDNTEGIKNLLFSWVFKLPLWQWLILASISGFISAWTLFQSFQVGVKSSLSFQKHLSYKCLTIINQGKYSNWVKQFDQPPRQVLLRILKNGIQLTGLVSRRITRAFMALLTFAAAIVVLLYLDKILLLLLLPLSGVYLVGLYYINRHAARVSNNLADTLYQSGHLFNQLVSSLLNKEISVDSEQFQQQYADSAYMQLAELKYQRRLVEIHVSWLNTLFLILGIASIISYFVYVQISNNIDWQHLLFFLIALKYAVSSLQEISSTTVAFSRFIPEVRLVYRLLNVEEGTQKIEKLDVTGSSLVYVSSTHLESFEIEQLKSAINNQQPVKWIKINEIRTQGTVGFFKQFNKQSQHHIIMDNNLARIQRFLGANLEKIRTHIDVVLLYCCQSKTIKKLSVTEFLQYKESISTINLDMDTFE